MPNNIIESLPVRNGHFLLESGYHTDLWFDLDRLFVDPQSITAHVEALVKLLQPFSISAVCGPLQGGAFLAHAIALHMGVRFYFTVPETLPDSTTGGTELFTAQYRLPKDLRGSIAGERVAVVDDVISAGSSVRATHAELTSAGAEVSVVGTILLLGDRAVEYFATRGISCVTLACQQFNLWAPEECPLCAVQHPLEDPH